MNSLFLVNLLIGCGMLLSGFKQLPVTFSWRKLAVIFLASGSLLLVEGMLVRKVFETALVLFVIAVLYLLLGLAGLVMMFVKKDRQAFTSEDWHDFAAVLIISALMAFYFLRDAAFDLSSMLLPEAMFLAGLLLVSWAVKAEKTPDTQKISELLLRDFCFVYLFAWVAWYGNLAGQNLAAGSLCLLPN
ncbi:hypothetical protein [Lactobacillus delbrueckii]|uniref:hypothetical protein n=1 Tax=Lactobacillus delbrueckii TaxID=1584 RepID=UPI0021A6704B|nr:hypothetical protein [Lactobacillus delbrueckii]MCT3467079.1 hypothetical protein [Lactobacillus delbrueckii subsp. bulgaricus]MCT3471959.1 hypothetical protein [Lactobacillus delbrueckii subsp. bulgaricus]